MQKARYFLNQVIYRSALFIAHYLLFSIPFHLFYIPNNSSLLKTTLLVQLQHSHILFAGVNYQQSCSSILYFEIHYSHFSIIFNLRKFLFRLEQYSEYFHLNSMHLMEFQPSRLLQYYCFYLIFVLLDYHLLCY